MKNMEEQQQAINYGREIAGWEVPEYDRHERTANWYILASIIAIALLIYAFFTANFLFAVIVIIGSLVTILHDGQEPDLVGVVLTTEGILVGSKFYDYDELKNFAIVYKPNYGVKKLYFELRNPVKPRLSIPLINMNPLPIRENLLRYLPEDLERTNGPLSGGFGKLIKL